MNSELVLLIGFEDQENLGLRSIKAYLDSKDINSVIVPYIIGNESELIGTIKSFSPSIIGFSIIFQFTIHDFARLALIIRKNGITSHLTAGGHFPSLNPESTFKRIPELDSIIMFEGEITLYELALNIKRQTEWVNIHGLAFRLDDKITINKPRPLIRDLDSLPLIYRDNFKSSSSGIKTAFLLASRGCLYNCSFCSIRLFYEIPQGALRRSRSPSNVADEIKGIHDKFGISLFSFQDDDFTDRTKRQKDWLHIFLDELDKRDLGDSIRWKISCRADGIELGMLEEMKAHGLILVYLGIESGNETGLTTLNKKINVSQNIASIEMIKSAGIGLSIGFMLFDPSSNAETVKQSIDFLYKIGSDGYLPVNFCKMLPYTGTPIERRLKSENRLTGDEIIQDYNLLDPDLDWYSYLVFRIFHNRNFSTEGLICRLHNLDMENRYFNSFPRLKTFDNKRELLTEIIAETNKSALNTLSILLDVVTKRGIDYLIKEEKTLLDITENEWRNENRLSLKISEYDMEFSKSLKKTPLLNNA